jgi:hypothetical protein
MDTTNEVEPTKPNPKRFWWLKRLSLAALVLVLLLAGLRLVWGQRVQSRLDETIADIKAKGEPILFTDLVYEPLPDAENGAWYLMQALQNWPSVPGQPGVHLFDTDWYMEGEEAGFADPITDNAAYLASCKPALDLLRQAGEIERSVWGSGVSRPLYYMLLPHLGNTRELARYVDDVAFRALDIGDTELAFETMLLQHTIARHSLGQNPTIIDSLVAMSIMSMNCAYIEKALPQIDPAELRDGRARELAKQVIATLTSDMLRDGMIQGLIGERAAMYDVFECLLDGTESAANMLYPDDPITWIIDTPGLSYTYRPALINEQLMVVQITTQFIESLKADVPYDVYQQLNDNYEHLLLEDAWQYPIASMFMPAYGATARTVLRNEVTQRCAAIAIAIKLYEADHGERPDTLDQLVPAYLPTLPADPYSKTGEPIRYNPSGVVPTIEQADWLTDEQLEQLKQQSVRPYPLLYSIGDDGKSQRGGPLYLTNQGDLNDGERYPSSVDGEQGDIWFMLDAWPKAIFNDADLGTEPDPFGLDEPWDAEPDEPESEAGNEDVEGEPGQGQDAEDQGDQPQP